MNRKKGFTLVELLAVIIILGILGLIVVPMVNDTIKEQKEKLYNRQLETIQSSAEGWSTKKITDDGTSVYVNVTTLVNDGYLKNKDIKDPRNNKIMSGCVSISYDEAHSQYVYDYVDSNEDTYQNECSNAY